MLSKANKSLVITLVIGTLLAAIVMKTFGDGVVDRVPRLFS